jgi:hypothetical protein
LLQIVVCQRVNLLQNKDEGNMEAIRHTWNLPDAWEGSRLENELQKQI